MVISTSKYFPREILQFERSGLTLYESKFNGVDGCNGVVCGPHPSFAENFPDLTHHGLGTYLTYETAMYRDKWAAGLSVSVLGNKELDAEVNEEMGVCYICKRPPRSLKIYEEMESAGTDVSYRCLECRNCGACKTSGRIESISIQEEVEQALIDRSVTVHPNLGYAEAKLPFTSDPKIRLKTNISMATKVYFSQIKRWGKSDVDKQQVIEAEKKLQTLEFVEYVDNLPEKEKKLVLASEPKNFLVWRPVWNLNSMTTSCRLVFDASQKDLGGCALNDILPKGINGMNKLINLLIKWSVHKTAFHCDIQKMYNSIQLDAAHWCYQLYLWEENLDPSKQPRWKVIKTLIYGVVSSGNQAECALRKTAKLKEGQYPRASDIIHNDTYVDDTISGEKDPKACEKSVKELKMVLKTGGFELKGVTLSGEDPPEHLSEDKLSVNTGGYKWFPNLDILKLKGGDFNFSKKTRGRKDTHALGVIPDKLTRSHCVGASSEVFDPLGRAVPITCGFKVDRKRLNGLAWDEYVSVEDKKLWDFNFSLIQDLKEVVFRRAIVPEDALNLDIQTLDVGDASSLLMCSAIYARFQLKSGGYSCQLVFARTKIVPDDMSMPRAELSAAVLNAATGHVVKMSFGKFHKGHIKLTDSQVALYWISTFKAELLLWVRNRVIEINRLAPMEFWRYVRSKDNIADMGTRKGSTIEDIGPESEWINGKPWMKLPVEEFPLLTVEEIKLSATELDDLNKERITPAPSFFQAYHTSTEEHCNDTSPEAGKRYKAEFQAFWASMKKPSDTSELGKRFAFSNYILDPTKFRMKKSSRVMTKNWSGKSKSAMSH